jgi:hypothetical protein
VKSDQELEQALRRALRPQAPPRDLAGPVLARLRARPVAKRPYFAWLALAACLLLAAGAIVRYTRQQVQEREARASATRIISALNLASADLSRIQQRIRATPVPRISQ